VRAAKRREHALTLGSVLAGSCCDQLRDVPECAAQHVTPTLWTNYKPTEDYPKALAEEPRAISLSGVGSRTRILG
jgi:hypothetical protein